MHYITKVDNIRSKLENDKRDPMDILERLIPRGRHEFKLELITLAQTKHLIRTFKSSGSTGYDDISSRTLKKCGDAIAPHMSYDQLNN